MLRHLFSGGARGRSGLLGRLLPGLAIVALGMAWAGAASAQNVAPARPGQGIRGPIRIMGPSSIVFAGTIPASPSVFGQNVQFLSSTSPGGGIPICADVSGGTIDLVEGVSVIASAAVNTVINTAALSVGGHTLFIRYNGNANCTASQTGTFGFTVNKANTTTGLTSSLNPSQRGQSVTFTATVNAVAPGAGTRTGTVTFRNGVATIGTGTLAGGVATFTTSALPVGTHSITAEYNGDGNFNGSTSAPVLQVVLRTATSTALTSSPNSSRFGQNVTFTATVTSSGGTPDGYVTFDDGDTVLAIRALNGAGVAVFTTTWLEVGLHVVRATYTGSDDFATSTSTTVDHTVIKTDTTVTLSRSPNSSTVYGQFVTFTAQVTANAPGAGTPTGFVLFQDGGNTIGVGFIDGTGEASFATSALSVDTHSIVASYGGDAGFNGDDSPSLSHTVNKADTSVTLTRTTDVPFAANPSKFGQNVIFTAEVTADAPGSGIPAGSVTFFDGANTLGTVDINADGEASFATRSLSVGGHTITATYNGSPSYNTSTSAGMSHTVQKADTTAAITVPPGAVTYKFGEFFSLQAKITVNQPGTAGPHGFPTGKVRFTFSPVVMFNGVGYLEADLAPDGNAYATIPMADFPYVGVYSVTAAYQGDGNFNASPASAARSITIQKADTTITITPATATQVYGQSVSYMATVSVTSPGSNIPGTTDNNKVSSGTVQITLTPSVGPAIVVSEPLTISGGSFNGTVQIEITPPPVPVGTYSVVAQYLPGANPNFNGSTSATGSLIINKANTSTSISASVNPALSGQTVTLTAQLAVISPGSGTPTGTVTFKSGGVAIPACTAVALVGLTATCNTSFTTGTYTLTAEYNGDANFNTSVSGGLNLVVVTSPTTLTLTDTSVPLITNFGQPASFQVTISPSAATGTIAFLRAGVPIAGCTAVALVAGSASCTTSALPAGDNPISATYTPTSDHTASSSNTIFHQVNPAPTTTVVTRLPNASTVYGQPVTFTATVSSAAGTPTGQVVFKSDGLSFATVTLSGGVASFTIASLPVGAHTISAVYLGSTNFASSTGTLAHTVLVGSTTTSVSSSVNPSVFGQSVTFTATVAPVAPSTGTPTGTVLFKDGAATIGMGTLNGSGQATFTTSLLAGGSHNITAQYAGDGNYNASTSPILVQVVNKANTTTTVTGSPNPSILGSAVTFTAVVAAVAPGGGTPTGTVTFLDGVTPIAGCVAVPLGGGQATCTTSALTLGSHTINANYSGSVNHNASSGSTTQVVSNTPVDLRVVKTSSPNPVQAGTNLTYAITVTNLSGPATSVTLTDALPSEITFVSTTAPGGWACVNPPVGGTGTITCTAPVLAAGASAVITVIVGVPLELPAGTILVNTASASGGLPDPDTTNNTSVNETTVYRTRRP